MFNKKILLILATATASIACTFSVMFTNDNIFTLRSYEQPYGITFNSSKNKFFSGGETTGYSGQATVITNNKNDIEFEYNSLVGGSSSSVWHIIKAGGYFYNLDPIHGLESVSIKCVESDKEYRVLWGFDCNFTLGSSVLSSSTSGLLCNFNNDRPTYFKVENISEDDFSIVNMDISLDCTNYYPVLTVLSDDEEKGTVSGGGIKHVGDSVTITANANSGYSFNGWYKGTSLLSNKNPYTFTMPSVDTEIKAEFLTGEMLLLDSNFEGDAVTVTGGGIYDLNEQVTISAEAIDELVFDGWYDRDYNLVSNSNPYTFQFTESTDLIAYYHYSSFTLKFTDIDSSLKTCSLDYSGYLYPSVYIPKLFEGYTVNKIADNAFNGCNQLVSVIIPNTIAYIGENAFQSCAIDTISISDSVLSIGSGAFMHCYDLTSITIGNGVERIENDTFHFCRSLSDVTLFDSLLSIGEYAFGDCDSLTSITIPDSVETIGEWAFAGCNSLTSIKFGSNLAQIGDCAFNGCVSLLSIIIPNGVNVIRSGTFLNCNSLLSVVVGTNITLIENNAFSMCDRLVEVVNKSSLDIVAGSTENGYIAYHAKQVITDESESKIHVNGDFVSYVDGDDTCLINYLGKELHLVIPNYLTSIGSYAFSNCTSLKSIIIPNSVKHIGAFAFDNCTSLTLVEIPDSITTIEPYTFAYCTSLNFITISNCITSIGSGAFFYCVSLLSITIPSTTVSIGSDAFSNCRRLVEIINKSSLNIVMGSQEYGSVGYYAKQIINDESESKLQIDENGFATYIDGDDVCLIGYLGNNTSIVIPNSVRSINEYAFGGCQSMVSIELGINVCFIGEYAFGNCDSLVSIFLSNNIAIIEKDAFRSCFSLTIYCELLVKPEGWSENWNPDNRPVEWGYLES